MIRSGAKKFHFKVKWFHLWDNECQLEQAELQLGDAWLFCTRDQVVPFVVSAFLYRTELGGTQWSRDTGSHCHRLLQAECEVDSIFRTAVSLVSSSPNPLLACRHSSEVFVIVWQYSSVLLETHFTKLFTSGQVLCRQFSSVLFKILIHDTC